MSGRDRPGLLDRPAARLAALGVAATALTVLAWYHRADILPLDPNAASPAQAAFRECFEPRAAQLAASLENGELTQAQVTLFRGRAEAFCADRTRSGLSGIASGNPPTR